MIHINKQHDCTICEAYYLTIGVIPVPPIHTYILAFFLSTSDHRLTYQQPCRLGQQVSYPSYTFQKDP